MKNFRTIGQLLALLIVPMLGFSQEEKKGVHWMSWGEAVEANAKEPRMIMVDTYTDWCGWCKKMDKSTFMNEIIADYMNEHYYAVKLDVEMKDTVVFNGYTFVNPRPDANRSTHQLAASLLDNKLSYPSFVFLDHTFQRIQILPGYRGPRQFEPIVRYYIEGAPNGITYEDFTAQFESLFPPKEPAN